MKKNMWAKLRFPVMLGLILTIIITGTVMIFHVFQTYNNLVLENTDNQLYSLARSVDRNVENKFERYAENMIHTIEHAERKEAEEQWLMEGDTSGLYSFFKGSLLGLDEEVVNILIRKDEKIVFSMEGNTNYRFPLLAGREGEVSIRPCIGEDGTVFLAFIKETDSGLEYAALINVASFYEDITDNLSAELQNEIVMMDAGEQTLIHRENGGVQVDDVEQLLESEKESGVLNFLLEQQDTGEEGTTFCDAVSGATSKAYTARMAVVPATEETNGFFAIGVSTDYDQTIRPMSVGAIRLTAYGAMVIAGILCLVIWFLRVFRGNQRALKELELLREKNAAMEELNRQTQELAHHQRLQLMGTLTSGIAHEFNNLLAPIMGYSILVLEKLPPEETELYDEVLEIYNTSIKAKTVVSRLSDLSRKNAGTDFHELSLDEMVQKVSELARPAKPENVDVKLSLNCQEQKITGNETQISQLLLNLILNGFHAMEEKGGVLNVSTEVIEKEEPASNVSDTREREVLLKVRDHGVGIPKDVLSRIFEPFFTTKKGGKGTGLGLAIVQQVVEDHHGEIRVESVEGEGTTFKVSFPALEK